MSVVEGDYMLLSFQESLSKLGRLSATQIDQTSRRIRADLAGAEWKMGVCLLALVRTSGFRTLGYAMGQTGGYD
jgi:hypothetical protein